MAARFSALNLRQLNRNPQRLYERAGAETCAIYSVTKGQTAIVELTRALRDKTGNLPPYPGVFPDFEAPIVRTAPDGVRELTRARWGMPTPTNFRMDAVRKKAAKLGAKGETYDSRKCSARGAIRRHQHSQRRQQALDPLDSRRASLRGSIHLVQRVRQGCWRRRVVRLRSQSATCGVRWHLDQLDVRPKGERRRDHERPIRLSDDRAE